MSASRTAEVTRRFLMSSSERNSPIGRMLKRWPCSVISPALTEKLLFCSSVASLLHVDVVRGHASGVDQDAHLTRHDALQLDARHARHALQRTLEVALERVVLIGEVLIGRDADHDRPADRTR
jgi:hypothetical protein